MPKSSTERSRIYRRKLKEEFERYNFYKARDIERKKVERSKQKLQNPEEVARKRELNRQRVRKFRTKQKGSEVKGISSSSACQDLEESSHAYSTPQALGKAVCKVQPHLPKSPRKRKAVVIKLAFATGIGIPKKRKSGQGNKSLSNDTVKKVKAFYLLDSVSRQSPGKRDFVINCHDGKKEYIQKRHLTWSLKETHALFLKENPTIKIGLSKFSQLRPINVLLSSDMPRSVCLCQHHENIKLICDCLSKEISNFPNYTGDFVDNFVCSPESEECMLGRCNKCPDWLDTTLEGQALEDPTLWYQWERVNMTVPGKKGSKPKRMVKKMKKICKEGTVKDVLPSFLEHIFIKRQQSQYFEGKLANLADEDAVVQVDFAVNYTCKYQDEIQAAHWNQEQVTLFTVTIWTKGTNGNICDSHVIVSDEMVHDKKAVAVFMSLVVDRFVKQKHPHITRVFVFSDGPSSQFKNKYRYVAHFLHKLHSKVHIQWIFFATSHGKGVVDGIGGTVKRVVWNAVTTRKAPAVVDAQSFSEVASKFSKSVSVFLVKQLEINTISASLCLKKCFNAAPFLPGISKFHCIEPHKNGYIQCRQYSYQIDSVKNGVPPDVDPCASEETVEPGSKPNVTNANTGVSCTIQQGIPDELLVLFKASTPFSLPHYISTQVDAVMNGLIPFSGSSLISVNHLQGLIGNSTHPQGKWLSNFVIDEYMNLIKSASDDKGVKVKTLSWETFERGESSVSAEALTQDKESPFMQDVILVPCNPIRSDHWFLLAVLPKKKLVLVLDSKAGDYVKPSSKKCLAKMGSILKDLDRSCNMEEWKFISNTKDDIPQQTNTYDCGVYTCL